MKRILCVTLLALVMLSTAWTSASAHLYPWRLSQLERPTDDHTWGGEDNRDSGTSQTTIVSQPNSYSITGFIQLDIFVIKLLAPIWFGPGSSSAVDLQNTTGEETTGSTSVTGNRTGN